MYDLNNYETVETRIDKFYEKHAEGRILTELIKAEGGEAIVKALIYVGQELKATGYAQEKEGASHVNKTSYVENCESSAIGRALANFNFAKKGARPSREEMEKVVRTEQAIKEKEEAKASLPEGERLAKQMYAIAMTRDKDNAIKTLRAISTALQVGKLQEANPEILKKIVARWNADKDEKNLLGLFEKTDY
jgi:aspartate/glutamate racemase